MNLLISGASIAGPALAFWLLRQGHEVTIVERAPRIRPGGYAVDIRGAGLDVIERMGLRETIRPFETDTLSNSAVDARGRRFGKMARGFGVIDPSDIEIMRGDLARILCRETEGAARYRFSDSIRGVRQSERGVAVTFESGLHEQYDLVVGADGVHSRTRACAFGLEETCAHDLGNCMAIFTTPNFLGLKREQLLFSACGRIASIKSFDEDKLLKVCVFFTREPGKFDPRDVVTQRRMVAAAFADAGWEFPRFIEAMKVADDFYCDITCQIRLDGYHRGRVALVGDAAYCPSPLSGQGTSLALVGAYVLAASLGEHGDDVASALASYDRRMKPFAEANQAIALKLARSFAPETPFQVWSRNLGMRLLPYLPGGNFIVRMALRGIADTARAIVLPEMPPGSATSKAA